jgi:hypothetical protein
MRSLQSPGLNSAAVFCFGLCSLPRHAGCFPQSTCLASTRPALQMNLAQYMVYCKRSSTSQWAIAAACSRSTCSVWCARSSSGACASTLRRFSASRGSCAQAEGCSGWHAMAARARKDSERSDLLALCSLPQVWLAPAAVLALLASTLALYAAVLHRLHVQSTFITCDVKKTPAVHGGEWTEQTEPPVTRHRTNQQLEQQRVHTSRQCKAPAQPHPSTRQCLRSPGC